MATKKTIAMLLVSLLVVMACANLDEDIRACNDLCSSKCTRDNTWATEACEDACIDLCIPVVRNQEEPHFRKPVPKIFNLLE